jgi:hypothetical protein
MSALRISVTGRSVWCLYNGGAAKPQNGKYQGEGGALKAALKAAAVRSTASGGNAKLEAKLEVQALRIEHAVEQT